MARYTIEHGKHKSSRLQHVVPVLALAFIVGASYSVYQKSEPSAAISEPVSALSSEQPKKQITLTQPLPWPSYGQAAYGTNDNGVVAASKEQVQQVPIASLAKVITALAVTKQKPLAPGQQGPSITITEKDLKIYEEYVQKSGAVVPVEAGEQITQYQMMQAMLQPSANNIADALAVWAFGSMEAYTTYANNMLKELGINNTTVSDASGFSPNTTSTAQDMVVIGGHYMRNPVLKEIALQPQSTIPFAGVIRNYNASLNKDGIIGIKVGDTDEAGRCFLVADIRDANKVSIAVTLGADHLSTAMADAVKVLRTGNTAYDSAIATQP